MIHSLSNYAIIHGNIFSGSRVELIFDSSVLVSNGKIKDISKDSARMLKNARDKGIPCFDVGGAFVGPGLIDMHIHGCGGHDTGEYDKRAALEDMAKFLCNRGVTTFQPAVVPELSTMSEVHGAWKSSEIIRYHVPSVYNEGPFIALSKKGGLPEESIRPFSPIYMEKLLSYKITTGWESNDSGTIEGKEKSLLGTMTFAPELEGAATAREMMEHAGVKVAWGHSAAYADQIPGADTGVSCSDRNTVKGAHFTHLFNAMNGIDHRRPGLALIPFLDAYKDSTCELIGDTVHVNPFTMKFIFENIGTDRICLISDSMAGGGLGPGESVYLGRNVVCDGMVSRYKDSGTLIGSAMMINDTSRHLVEKGFIQVDDIFKIASVNPARVLGLDDRGAISVGRRGDIVVLDKSLQVKEVFITRVS